MSLINKGIYLMVMVCLIILVVVEVAYGIKERENKEGIEALEFMDNSLYISQYQVRLEEIIDRLVNKEEWRRFISDKGGIQVYIDPRSGRPVSVVYSLPIIPGAGYGNNIKLSDVSQVVGYEVKEITADVVRDLLIDFIKEKLGIIRDDLEQIGEVRINEVAFGLWHVHMKRQYRGIPVRDANISFAIKEGNLVLWGLEKWGDIDVSLDNIIDIDRAIEIGFNFIGGRAATDEIINRPHLEYVPVDAGWTGEVGKGYSYKIVWVIVFKRSGYNNTWEIVVDAKEGKVISLRDLNLYIKGKVIGAIYPVSSDECCPDGCADVDAPIHSYECTPGNNYCTSMDTKYITINDSCGVTNECSDNCVVDAGGSNGQHDCSVPAGHSAGDTFATRTNVYEINRINRDVASWLSLNWLNMAIISNVNIDSTCSAYWSGDTINFYRSGGGCRNTGEIAAVFDHEWWHGVDYNDTAGLTNPSEAIADIGAAMRLHDSCIARGFWWSLNRGCGQWINCPSNPGVSYGYNCSGYSSATECCLSCTGIRDIDYLKHADQDPETIGNFTCSICSATGALGPCGREVHCESIPPAEAGWDLAAYDLQAAPFNYDKQTAFLLASRIIWRGNNNVTNWYSCTCPNASGCGASNAHYNWLLADDDDGNISNGTPHASAIYAALNRHGIACASASQVNSGCAGGPTAAPLLTGNPGNNSVSLSWTPVSGAANYYIWRTEGVKGCDFGKVKIATISTTSHTDTEVFNGRTYYYTVQAVGSNTNCLGPLSNCISVTPSLVLHASYQSDTKTDSCPSGGQGDNDGVIDPGETIVTAITIINDGTGALNNISGVLSTLTPGITILDDTATFPDISSPGGTSTSNTPHFTYKVNDEFTCGGDINFDLELSYSGGSNLTNFTHKVGQLGSPVPIFNETWESGSSNWTMTGLWHLTTEAAQNCMPEPYPSSITVAYYGQDATCNYDTGSANNGNLDTVNAISGVTANSELKFMFVNRNEGDPNYDISYVYVSPDGITWTQVWIWAGSQQPTWAQAGPISLSSWAGQPIYLRFRFNTVDNVTNNYLGWVIDNIQVTASSWQCNICQINPPGRVLNNLTISKFGENLAMNWMVPGGTCYVEKFAVYRGTLPWSGYNHHPLDCNVSNTSYITLQDIDSYYYLVVPNNADYEGSYGLDSNGNERLPLESACKAQNLFHCN